MTDTIKELIAETCQESTKFLRIKIIDYSDYPSEGCEHLENLCILINKQRNAIKALLSDNERMKAALEEITECFDAAYFEGLIERMTEQENTDAGSLFDLINRRLLPALNIAQAALKARGE